MADTSQQELSEPHTNGVIDGLTEEEKSKMRPADIDADMREMERRKRVEMMMNSRLFREELERIIETQMKDGAGPSGLLQQISEMMGPQGARFNANVFKNSNCVVPINDIRGVESMGYAKGEKLLRCKLAAVFRLLDLYGWTQGVGGQITARLNQDQEHFLVNPYGLLYHEVTASSLVKVDMQGMVVEQGTTNFGVHVAGFQLHSTIHAARPDIKCIVHIATPSVTAISSMKCGLLPLGQESIVIGEVSNHQYIGGSFEPEEREKITRNLGPISKVMLLTNRGALCCGETVEEAFFNVYNTVLACETQLKLMPAGLENMNLISEESKKAIFEASRKPPNPLQASIAEPSPLAEKLEKRWRIGGTEFEALMRMLDNAGFRTGYIYRHPLVKSEPPRPRNDVEVPPAVSSLGYLLEEEELYKQGLWKGGRKGTDRTRWLNSPNVYQKVEILETGTPDPKKITKWVDQSAEEWVTDGSPTHSSTPVRIESALQFVPKNTNPKEFKQIQQQIKDYRRADKISAGPQSHILEGVTWEEAKKMQDATISGTGEQVVLVGAASKGIIQRGFQHNAMVYKTPYAKNPFDAITDQEIDQYKKDVERKQKGDPYDESQSESEALSSFNVSRATHESSTAKSPIQSPISVTSETEEESRDEPRVLRIATRQVPVPSQPEVVLSDADATTKFLLNEMRRSTIESRNNVNKRGMLDNVVTDNGHSSTCSSELEALTYSSWQSSESFDKPLLEVTKTTTVAEIMKPVLMKIDPAALSSNIEKNTAKNSRPLLDRKRNNTLKREFLDNYDKQINQKNSIDNFRFKSPCKVGFNSIISQDISRKNNLDSNGSLSNNEKVDGNLETSYFGDKKLNNSVKNNNYKTINPVIKNYENSRNDRNNFADVKSKIEQTFKSRKHYLNEEELENNWNNAVNKAKKRCVRKLNVQSKVLEKLEENCDSKHCFVIVDYNIDHRDEVNFTQQINIDLEEESDFETDPLSAPSLSLSEPLQAPTLVQKVVDSNLESDLEKVDCHEMTEQAKESNISNEIEDLEETEFNSHNEDQNETTYILKSGKDSQLIDETECTENIASDKNLNSIPNENAVFETVNDFSSQDTNKETTEVVYNFSKSENEKITEFDTDFSNQDKEETDNDSSNPDNEDTVKISGFSNPATKEETTKVVNDFSDRGSNDETDFSNQGTNKENVNSVFEDAVLTKETEEKGQIEFFDNEKNDDLDDNSFLESEKRDETDKNLINDKKITFCESDGLVEKNRLELDDPLSNKTDNYNDEEDFNNKNSGHETVILTEDKDTFTEVEKSPTENKKHSDKNKEDSSEVEDQNNEIEIKQSLFNDNDNFNDSPNKSKKSFKKNKKLSAENKEDFSEVEDRRNEAQIEENLFTEGIKEKEVCELLKPDFSGKVKKSKKKNKKHSAKNKEFFSKIEDPENEAKFEENLSDEMQEKEVCEPLETDASNKVKNSKKKNKRCAKNKKVFSEVEDPENVAEFEDNLFDEMQEKEVCEPVETVASNKVKNSKKKNKKRSAKNKKSPSEVDDPKNEAEFEQNSITEELNENQISEPLETLVNQPNFVIEDKKDKEMEISFENKDGEDLFNSKEIVDFDKNKDEIVTSSLIEDMKPESEVELKKNEDLNNVVNQLNSTAKDTFTEADKNNPIENKTAELKAGNLIHEDVFQDQLEKEYENFVKELSSSGEKNSCSDLEESSLRNKEEKKSKDKEKESSFCEEEDKNSDDKKEKDNSFCDKENPNINEYNELKTKDFDFENIPQGQMNNEYERGEMDFYNDKEENSFCDKDKENSSHNKGESSLYDKEENSFHDEEKKNVSYDKEEENSFNDEEEENSFNDKEEESSFHDKEEESSFYDKEEVNSFCDKEKGNVSYDKEQKNSSHDKKQDNSSYDEEQENLYRDKEQENSSHDKEQENSSRDKEQENSVHDEDEQFFYDNEEEISCHHKEKENYFLNEEKENFVHDKEQENSFYDKKEEEESSFHDREEENNFYDKEKGNVFYDKEQENSVPNIEKENSDPNKKQDQFFNDKENEIFCHHKEKETYFHNKEQEHFVHDIEENSFPNKKDFPNVNEEEKHLNNQEKEKQFNAEENNFRDEEQDTEFNDKEYHFNSEENSPNYKEKENSFDEEHCNLKELFLESNKGTKENFETLNTDFENVETIASQYVQNPSNFKIIEAYIDKIFSLKHSDVDTDKLFSEIYKKIVYEEDKESIQENSISKDSLNDENSYPTNNNVEFVSPATSKYFERRDSIVDMINSMRMNISSSKTTCENLPETDISLKYNLDPANMSLIYSLTPSADVSFKKTISSKNTSIEMMGLSIGSFEDLDSSHNLQLDLFDWLDLAGKKIKRDDILNIQKQLSLIKSCPNLKILADSSSDEISSDIENNSTQGSDILELPSSTYRELKKTEDESFHHELNTAVNEILSDLEKAEIYTNATNFVDDIVYDLSCLNIYIDLKNLKREAKNLMENRIHAFFIVRDIVDRLMGELPVENQKSISVDDNLMENISENEETDDSGNLIVIQELVHHIIDKFDSGSSVVYSPKKHKETANIELKNNEEIEIQNPEIPEENEEESRESDCEDDVLNLREKINTMFASSSETIKKSVSLPRLQFDEDQTAINSPLNTSPSEIQSAESENFAEQEITSESTDNDTKSDNSREKENLRHDFVTGDKFETSEAVKDDREFDCLWNIREDRIEETCNTERFQFLEKTPSFIHFGDFEIGEEKTCACCMEVSIENDSPCKLPPIEEMNESFELMEQNSKFVGQTLISPRSTDYFTCREASESWKTSTENQVDTTNEMMEKLDDPFADDCDENQNATYTISDVSDNDKNETLELEYNADVSSNLDARKSDTVLENLKEFQCNDTTLNFADVSASTMLSDLDQKRASILMNKQSYYSFGCENVETSPEIEPKNPADIMSYSYDTREFIKLEKDLENNACCDFKNIEIESFASPPKYEDTTLYRVVTQMNLADTDSLSASSFKDNSQDNL